MGDGNRTAPSPSCRGNAGGHLIAIDKRIRRPEKAIGVNTDLSTRPLSPLSIDRTHLDISRGI